jgi:hypothetical protein
MSSNLPTTSPAEALDISPEQLEVANCYLQDPSISNVAETLDVTPQYVAQMLEKREVKSYIDSVFYNLGYNNRFKLRGLMDAIIKKKLQDMDESETGSTKDISELLALSHKMTVEMMDREIKLETLRAANNIKTQTNIQINAPGGSKYTSLIEKLMQQDIIDV